jgi:FixJ family two-component response regulator
MKEPTIFIIDDDQSVRSGLQRLLKAAGKRVESFASPIDFLNSEKKNWPGCIILDFQMPEMTGIELQERLIQDEIELPIIFLSGQSNVPITSNAMKKGAVDFLTKPVDVDELMEAIQISLEKDIVNRKQRAMSSSIQKLINTLTSREYEVMTYVITGLLNKQIASELVISEETVKIHRGRVMRKLGIVSIAELVRFSEKGGIVPAKL